MVEGRLDLDRLQDATLPDEAVAETLGALRGLGPYAVAHVLMLLGRYDFLPIDTWLRRTVSEAWFGGRAVTDREILDAFERFQPYRALAYHFYEAVPAGGAERAYRYSLLAAERATRLLAFPEAAEAYGQALDVLDPDEWPPVPGKKDHQRPSGDASAETRALGQ